MRVSTNSLMSEIESVFLLEVDSSETMGRAIDFYNEIWRVERDNLVLGEVYLSLRRTGVRHNFRSGYIWISYTRRIYNEAGISVAGSQGVSARLRIEKINGSWEVVEICERMSTSRHSEVCYPSP